MAVQKQLNRKKNPKIKPSIKVFNKQGKGNISNQW